MKYRIRHALEWIFFKLLDYLERPLAVHPPKPVGFIVLNFTPIKTDVKFEEICDNGNRPDENHPL